MKIQNFEEAEWEEVDNTLERIEEYTEQLRAHCQQAVEISVPTDFQCECPIGDWCYDCIRKLPPVFVRGDLKEIVMALKGLKELREALQNFSFCEEINTD